MDLRLLLKLLGKCNNFNWEGNGTPLQYSCLENPLDGGAWWAAVHGVAEGRTRLSNFTFTFHFHALQKEMAPHSSTLAWRLPGTGGAWWAAVCGVAQRRTRLKWLSSSSVVQSGWWFLFLIHADSLCLFNSVFMSLPKKLYSLYSSTDIYNVHYKMYTRMHKITMR